MIRVPRAVLLTRPVEDAAPLARRLEALGHRAVVEPLLTIRYLDSIAVDLSGVQALAFTSANGVRALIHARPDAAKAGLPVFAVGAATAAAARDAGFASVTSGAGDVESLARVIVAQTSPGAGALLHPGAGAILHIAGRERAGDLVAALQDAGFTARRLVLYAAEGVTALSGETQAALRAGQIDDVIIFSPRTARQFVTLITQARLQGAVARLRLVALSARVAEAAKPLAFATVSVASRPDQDALLDLFDAGVASKRQD